MPRLAFCLVFFAVCSAFAGDREVLTVDANPRPDALPTLGVWQEHVKKQGTYYTNLSARFPNLPEFACDLWCFESPGIQFISAQEIAGGGVELRHAWEGRGEVIVTTATPRVGALDVVACLQTADGRPATDQDEYPALNICWQLRRAPAFASEPDPYPEFVRRCFIFTESGQTFLLDTIRRPIPVKRPTHKRNNPPWVQMYLPRAAPAEIRAEATGWADYSPDRFTVPLIGAVSRDRKYLAAMASGSEAMVCQAWHDCMHNNARWLPVDGSSEKQWRVVIYAMDNDPAALLARFHRDFPIVEPWR